MALIYEEMVIFAVMIKIKIINKGHHPLPEYATPLSAGMDLRANIDEPITLKPMQRMLIPTALYMAPGTIDADYRGELKVLLVNFSDTDFIVNDGERIAQMIIAKHENADFIEVEELDDTERGTGGYGHTGVK